MSEESKPHVVKSHDIGLDSDYVSWVHDVKQRYVSAQIKSAVKVNTEQLFFNWQLGRDLVERKAEEKWGKGIVEQLSLDLQNEFPKAKGFSARNLWNMKKWYLFYSENESFSELAYRMEESLDMKSLKLHQLGAEMEFPSVFGFVPWRHHVEIVTKCKTIEEALFYVRKTVEESWSRSVLIDNIKAHLYQSSGNALTNFAEKLPTIQGKLAQEIVKDTYDFGFVSLPAGYDEKELEDALEQNITRFLLELGSGFAFIGRQKEIIVAGKTRKIDMLFYHIKLRCYVVVELKAVSFEPEFAGKLNFYVNAVNQLMKTDDDNPTIGLLICKDKDQTEVQWAFQGIETPMGVATYDNIRMNEIKSQLPSEEAIQKRLEQAEEEYLLKLQEKFK
ncbi:MAG: PDDEXK nuclease domain-containing protein [Clostridium sp.]|nr:PDDEXK nuclease domain-containing protein [Clostridium sp.]MDY4877146.1 PDDEXK nuclease domain-containing protein [Eubacterium sp.]